MSDQTIIRAMSNVGYTDAQIRAGLLYADEAGAIDPHARLRCALTRILYTDAQIAAGAGFQVETDGVACVHAEAY